MIIRACRYNTRHLYRFLYTQLGLLPSDTDWTIAGPKQLGSEDGKTSLKFINCKVDKEIFLDY
jgi:hypothetical protein